MKTAKIFYKDSLAGVLTETESGYEFCYDKEYLETKGAEAVSLTLPSRPNRINPRSFSRSLMVLYLKDGCLMLR